MPLWWCLSFSLFTSSFSLFAGAAATSSSSFSFSNVIVCVNYAAVCSQSWYLSLILILSHISRATDIIQIYRELIYLYAQKNLMLYEAARNWKKKRKKEKNLIIYKIKTKKNSFQFFSLQVPILYVWVFNMNEKFIHRSFTLSICSRAESLSPIQPAHMDRRMVKHYK